ncbi:MAG: hypothetical protein RIM80_12735, partial [Alphaproteobacteria bacterium]
RATALLATIAGALQASPAAAAGGVCRYDGTAETQGGFPAAALDVAIRCDRPATPRDFDFDHGGGAYATWAPEGGLAYRVALGPLAAAGRGSDFAATSAGVLAPIGAWLAAPGVDAGVGRLEFAFLAPAGVRLLVNLAEADRRDVLARADWRFAGYSVLTARAPLIVAAPGPAAFAAPGREGPDEATIRIALLDDGFRMTPEDFSQWIGRFAGLVARYWAGFPSDRLLIAVTPGGRPRAPFGRVRGGGGATMLLRIDRDETPAFLHQDDWVLTHELVHLGAPFAPRRQPWFMEGMATYLEPTIRALGGALPRNAVWDEWLRAMPTGAAGISAMGLEGGGHPYWTGGLFFLMADVELARRGDVDGLARCCRAVRRELGDAASRSTIGEIVAVCDRAIGAPVLETLSRRYAVPAEVDLESLWRELGVTAGPAGVSFAETGAELRRALFDGRRLPAPRP